MSKYDLAQSVMTAPDGTSLKDMPRVRSLFQKLMGEQNLEAKLNKMAQDPEIQKSLRDMENASTIADPTQEFPHNRRIRA